MSDSLCPICNQSRDEGSDHSLCEISTLAAILATIGGLDVDTAISAIVTAAYGAGFAAKFTTTVGIPEDGSSNGKYRGYAEIVLMRGPLIRQLLLTTDDFDTPEEASSACDDLYETFEAYCRTQGNVQVLDDPIYGRNQN
jgi:hypothetical protein